MGKRTSKQNVMNHNCDYDQASRPISTGPLERITALTRPAYRPGSLPGVFRDLAVRETRSWEELGT